MIFKISENKEQSSNFVEIIHANNISEEVLEILQTTKQPFIPSLYEKTFNTLLEQMPPEVKARVDILRKEYDHDNSYVTSDDVKRNFDVIVRMLQSIAEIYNKAKDAQASIHHSATQLKDADSNMIATIGVQMDRELTNTVVLLTRNIAKLKKEYSIVKNYVQGVHDPSVFDKEFAMAYNYKNLVTMMIEDIDYLTYEDTSGHGVCLITLDREFVAELKQNRSKLQKSEDSLVEELLVKKALGLIIDQSLRKNDYIGLSEKGDFVIFMRGIVQNTLENFIANFIFAIQSSRLFSAKNHIKVCASGLFLREPGSIPSDIIQKLESMIARKQESNDESPFIVDEL